MKATISNHPGYFGFFTRDQAEGAITNGTRIVKANSEPGDGNADGAPGVVLGSLAVDVLQLGPRIAYFVEWDARPRMAVFVADSKVTPASRS